MGGFTKLHSTIINSSIWDEPDSVRIVWITLLAMADASGFVESSLGGLAHQARKTKDDVTSALRVLESPDSDSKNPDHEGRRIRKVEGGWMLLNYAIYRDKQELSDDPEAIASRERVRRHRERKKQERYSLLHGVTGITSASASASEYVPEGTGEGNRSSTEVPTLAECRAFASHPTCGFPPELVEEWHNKQCDRGWGQDWRARMRGAVPTWQGIQHERKLKDANASHKPKKHAI